MFFLFRCSLYAFYAMIQGNASNRKCRTLREFRIAAGLSQEALARQIGVSLQTIGTWERGVNLPSFDKAAKLAEVLEISLKAAAISVGIDVSKIPDDCVQPEHPAPPSDRPEDLERPVMEPPVPIDVLFEELKPPVLPSDRSQPEQPVPPGVHSERLEQSAPPSDRPQLEPPALSGDLPEKLEVPSGDRPQLEQPAPPEAKN